jgi:anti-anti-sigma factor
VRDHRAGEQMETQPFLTVEIEDTPSTVTVKPFGELDLDGVPTVMAAIDKVFAGQDQIVVDLRGLTFLDSTGLRMMLMLHNGHYPAKVAFVEPADPQVERILELVALRDAFDWVQAA